MRHRRIAVSAAGVWLAVNGPAIAAPPPQPTAPPPDESFLEFLGKDDVDDAKLWDLFKRQAKHPAPKDEDTSDDDSADEEQTK